MLKITLFIASSIYITILFTLIFIGDPRAVTMLFIALAPISLWVLVNHKKIARDLPSTYTYLLEKGPLPNSSNLPPKLSSKHVRVVESAAVVAALFCILVSIGMLLSSRK